MQDNGLERLTALRMRLTQLANKRGREDEDPNEDHSDADDALLEYINDPIVSEQFMQIRKWYA